VSSWAQANWAPSSEAIRQASETVRVRISAPVATGISAR
jgi:hypothetical protein